MGSRSGLDLAAVKNVGGNAIESIMKARAEVGGQFKSFWEFCEKVDLRVMNKRVIESLIKAVRWIRWARGQR
jgi:DNA polymerase-3 subunit alpha